MKNTLTLQRDFGEVIVKAALPSLEDFVKKISNGRVETALNHIPSELHKNFYCPELTHIYVVSMDAHFRDFYPIIEKEGLFDIYYNFGATFFTQDNSLNMLPFFSKGISVEKTLKFTGVYSEETLNKAARTLHRLIEFIKDFRKPVSITFEVNEEINPSPVHIKL